MVEHVHTTTPRPASGQIIVFVYFRIEGFGKDLVGWIRPKAAIRHSFPTTRSITVFFRCYASECKIVGLRRFAAYPTYNLSLSTDEKLYGGRIFVSSHSQRCYKPSRLREKGATGPRNPQNTSIARRNSK